VRPPYHIDVARVHMLRLLTECEHTVHVVAVSKAQCPTMLLFESIEFLRNQLLKTDRPPNGPVFTLVFRN
jgi:hypothetical protein